VSSESETVAALRRAGVRVAYHLLRAGVESLKALEALVDELAKVGSEPEDRPDDGPVRIDIE
jgi:hypothetical protein